MTSDLSSRVRAAIHHPVYTYCPSPDDCCFSYGPVAITCADDGQAWPCETKRAHHTGAHVARVRRWVNARLRRGYEAYPIDDGAEVSHVDQ